MGNSGWSVSKFLKHFREIYACRISNTLDVTEDEAIYSEETAELAMRRRWTTNSTPTPRTNNGDLMLS